MESKSEKSYTTQTISMTYNDQRWVYAWASTSLPRNKPSLIIAPHSQMLTITTFVESPWLVEEGSFNIYDMKFEIDNDGPTSMIQKDCDTKGM